MTAPPACWSAAAPKATCEFRLGQRWAAERLQGSANRTCVRWTPPERLAVAWVDAADAQSLAAALRAAAPAPARPADRDDGSAGTPWLTRTPPWHAPRPDRAAAWVGQALLYALFALVIGVFSRWPTYQHLGPDQALIKLSFTHTGKPVGDCRPLSADELAKLPPNMRAPMKCPRERSPVTVEVDIGGVPVLQRVAAPSGLSRDGASAVYQRLQVAAGEQRIAVRLNDDARQRRLHAPARGRSSSWRRRRSWSSISTPSKAASPCR